MDPYISLWLLCAFGYLDEACSRPVRDTCNSNHSDMIGALPESPGYCYQSMSTSFYPSSQLNLALLGVVTDALCSLRYDE